MNTTISITIDGTDEEVRNQTSHFFHATNYINAIESFFQVIDNTLESQELSEEKRANFEEMRGYLVSALEDNGVELAAAEEE